MVVTVLRIIYTVKEDLYFKYKEESYLECR
jgi:hypothetical protein